MWISRMDRACKIGIMCKLIVYFGILLSLVGQEVKAAERDTTAFNPSEVIFRHLGDEYGWTIELPGDRSVVIPLPVIVRGYSGNWHIFSSARLQDQHSYRGFSIATEGKYAGKVVESLKGGKEYRPLDLSVTKNVLASVICAVVVMLTLFPMVRWYKRHPLEAPRKGLGLMEMILDMVYGQVILPVLGKDARRFAPYLLTLFFFILFSNLLGLIVVFPGGANVMGNISVTLVLAVCTFVVVNVSGTKRYWKETLWPDVPLWLKFPLPLMPLIEIFGVFTKPVSLMIRLFANMMAGHLITLVLISLIFVFGAWGTAATAGTTVISVLFAVFMGIVDLLICFIQAYVFMMLSTIFISLARVTETEKPKKKVHKIEFEQ